MTYIGVVEFTAIDETAARNQLDWIELENGKIVALHEIGYVHKAPEQPSGAGAQVPARGGGASHAAD